MASRVLVVRVDLDRLQKYCTIGSILSFGVAALAAVGEYLHWWGDFGPWLWSLATPAGLLLGIIAALVSATKGQAREIAVGVKGSNAKLDQANVKLDENNAMLRRFMEAVVTRLDRQTELLEEIRDRLPS